MAKVNKSKKPPSRQRYDNEHPTRSVRLDKEHDERLGKLLEGLGFSFSGYVKAHIRKDEAMIEKKAEMLASRQVDPSAEDRLKCVEDLVRQVFFSTVDTDESPPHCPHCDNQELIRCVGRQMGSNLTQPWVITWKCPKCGFFIDTYKRVDPKSIRWLNLRYVKPADKSRISARHPRKKHK